MASNGSTEVAYRTNLPQHQKHQEQPLHTQIPAPAPAQAQAQTPAHKSSCNITITNPHQQPPPEELDTGVSNGDVDWLFRGKSKKLVKKLASNANNDTKETTKQSEETTPPTTGGATATTTTAGAAATTNVEHNEKPTETQKQKLLPSNASTTKPPITDAEKQTLSLENNYNYNNNNSKSTKYGEQIQKPTAPTATANVSSANKLGQVTGNAPPQPEKTSKLDRLIGRSRSSSTSAVPSSQENKSKPTINPQQPSTNSSTKRRSSSSFNFMGSAAKEHVYNDHDEGRLPLRSTNSISSTSTSTSTSNTSSPSVSRSNSGKKGLFSSLSSKFKPTLSNTLQSQQQQQQHEPQQQLQPPPPPQQQQQHSSHASPKLNPHLIGSASNPKKVEDLVSLTNTSPAGSGIPIKRRTSSSSKDAGTRPVFKDSFLDESAISTTPPNDGLNRFFRRRSSATSASSKSTAMGHNGNNTTNLSRVILNKNKTRVAIPIRDLQDVKMRRVTFAVDKLDYDPQQQIPSRRPRKGNVLIPQDLNAPPPRLCLGIAAAAATTTTTSAANDSRDKQQQQQQQQQQQYSEREIALALEAQMRALLEAERHQHEAHLQAKKIANEVASFKHLRSGKLRDTELANVAEAANEDESNMGRGLKAQQDEEDAQEEEQEEIEVDSKISKKFATKASIDQPLHVHEQHFDDEDPTLKHDGSGVSLETVYTRCCHLREILPIPATLKQLKNKKAPLEILKMLNPKPTLIDVLSFADFIAITPINAVIFDNVTMTTEMLKCFLVSLVHSKTLEKLSLRNVAIDSQGWKLLCAFLAENKTLKKLDISQQRVKSETPQGSIRGNLNWDLFISAIMCRGGIEELVINGCKLSDETFEKLITKAVSLGTRRLGVASIAMTLTKAQIVADYISNPKAGCVGIDIACNDLSEGQLQPFIDAFNHKEVNLMFLSLHSTNLSNVKEAKRLFKSIINLKFLRFLDISSIPKIFPDIISSLAEYIPLYSSLRRLHMDLNELSPQAIGSIAMFLHKVPYLVHLSLLGNRDLNHSAAATLYSAVKESKTLFALDLDYDLVSDDLSQRIAFYLMRNMNSTMSSLYHISSEVKDEDLMFDGSLLMETAEKLLSEVDHEGHKVQQGGQEKENIKIQQIISNAMLERTRAVRKDIHKTIDTLFQKRNQGQLSFDGKETLIRFCLLDSSLEKLVLMFEENAHKWEGKSFSAEQTPEIQISQLENVGQLLSPIPQPTHHQQPPLQQQQQQQQQHNELQHPFQHLQEAHELLHHNSSEVISAGPILSPMASQMQSSAHYFSIPIGGDDSGTGYDNGNINSNTIGNTNNVNYMNNTNNFNLQPHQVVVESNVDGKDVVVDRITGRPVLTKTISQTSLHAREQEIEEGEFHKLNFFIQLRNSEANAENDLTRASGTEDGHGGGTGDGANANANASASASTSANALAAHQSDLRREIPLLSQLPSGPELRDAIIKAKGIDNVNELINRINNKSGVEGNKPITSEIKEKPRHTEDPPSDEAYSIDSGSTHNNPDPVVDEVYDKLLNDAERVRLNK